jgi:hydrogenase nickel incorporation protein HypA/HybF
VHEFGLAEPLLRAALELSARHGGLPIERVCARIGRLRAVAPDALLLAFDALKQGTAAQGATLDWIEVPPAVRCSACRTIFEPENNVWVCSGCGGAGGELLSGNELVMERVILRAIE